MKLRERKELEDQRGSKRKTKGSSRQSRIPDVAELGITKFDICDTFNMYE